MQYIALKELEEGKEKASGRKGKLFTCKSCGKDFTSIKYCKSRIPKFCNSLCYGKSLEISKKCQLCNKDILNNNQRKHTRVYCSNECRNASRKGSTLSKEWRDALSEGRKKSEKCRGENLYNWKGGQAKRDDTRTTREYREWRRSVFIRDTFTCVKCSATGVYLHAHHIKEKSKFPELIHDITNGMTLCIPCHNNVHGFNTGSSKKKE